MAQIFAAILLHGRDFRSAQAATLQTFLDSPLDRRDGGVRARMLMLFVVLDLVDGADDAAIAARLAEEDASLPGFLDAFAGFLTSLPPEFVPDGVNSSAFGLANLERLEGAILATRGEAAAAPD